MKIIKRSYRQTALLLLVFGISQVMADNRSPQSTGDFIWDIPASVALPLIPADNPMTMAGFELGRHLFYDLRMSAEGNIACGSCHHQDKAFSDGRSRPVGTYGGLHPRNAQALANTGWYSTFNWANPVIVTLERQIRGPMFGDDPHEHGLSEANQERILATLAADPVYQSLFAAAYPQQPGQWNYYRHVIPALASFVRGLTSFDAPYDRYLEGDQSALDDAALRGMALFDSAELQCSQCHRLDHFLTDAHVSQKAGSRSIGFHDDGAVPTYRFPNTGRFEATGKPEHLGQFRTPGLRNIALTAPYMHDGSIADLRSVIRQYARGGNPTPNRDARLQGFSLSATQESDLLAFLCSLTDVRFINNPRYQNPWPDADGKPRAIKAVSGASMQCQ